MCNLLLFYVKPVGKYKVYERPGLAKATQRPSFNTDTQVTSWVGLAVYHTCAMKCCSRNQVSIKHLLFFLPWERLCSWISLMMLRLLLNKRLNHSPAIIQD